MPSGGRVLLQVNRRLERELKEVGGANKPEMIAGAKVMKQAFRKVLGVKGTPKTPSKPGQPPKRQKGDLYKSVVSGAVGTAQRIGLTDHAATLMEFGVDTRADSVAPRSRKGLFSKAAREVKRESRMAHYRKVVQREKGSKKAKHTKIEARPFTDKAIALAEQKMVDQAVSSIRRRLPGGF